MLPTQCLHHISFLFLSRREKLCTLAQPISLAPNPMPTHHLIIYNTTTSFPFCKNQDATKKKKISITICCNAML